MAVSLDDENRVAIPPSVLGKIANLNRDQSEHVQTQLRQITEAEYTPAKLIYKQYGDLKVFRCGDEMRIFGVILENLEYVSSFDHVVIVLDTSEHEYGNAGVEKRQARRLQSKYAGLESEEAFYRELDGELFDASDVRQFLERRRLSILYKPQPRKQIEPYSSSRSSGFSRYSISVLANAAASAPSTMRWSMVSEMGSVCLATTSPSSTTGRCLSSPMPRIATSG